MEIFSAEVFNLECSRHTYLANNAKFQQTAG
jgi:hypothetical protein